MTLALKAEEADVDEGVGEVTVVTVPPLMEAILLILFIFKKCHFLDIVNVPIRHSFLLQLTIFGFYIGFELILPHG